MKRKLGPIIAILLVLLCGCSTSTDNNKTNQENDKGSLQIVSLNIPSIFPNLINNEESQKIGVERNQINRIEIIFNEEIVDNDYTLAYMQYANYYGIKSEYDEDNHIFLKYIIDKNKLVITAKDGYPESGIISILVPANLKSITGKTLGYDRMIMFTSNTLNSEDLYKFENSYTRRDIKSIIQIKKHNDGKRVAFTSKEASLYSSEDIIKGAAMVIERGESVLILDDSLSMYKVEIMFPKKYSQELFGDNLEIEEKDTYYSIKGFIEKECLIELPEPMNKDVYYLAAPMIDENDPNIHVMISEPVTESYDIIIWDDVNKIEEEDLHDSEAAAISLWGTGYIFGGKYLTVYVDEKGNFDYPMDYVERHMPQYNWNETDYNTYIKAYNMYCDYLLSIYDNFIFPDNLSKQKERIKEQINNIILLERTWINWGYENKLKDKNYFFDILRKELPENVQGRINEIDFTYDTPEEFNNLIATLINTMYDYYGSYEKINNLMTRIQKRYIMIEIAGVIDQVDLKNGIFYVINDYDKELYPLLIDDNIKNEIKLVNGENISILCNYNFDRRIWNVKSINSQ